MIFEFTARIQVEWDDEGDAYDKLGIGDQIDVDEAVKDAVDNALRNAEGPIDVNDIEMDLSIAEVRA